MTIVAIFMLMMAAGIAGVWTVDIVRSPEIDRSHGLLRARAVTEGTVLLPHWLAEYGTAALLATGGIGLLVAAPWAEPVSLFALGALIYTSLNSLGWVLSRSERRPYGVPMLIGLVGGVAAAVYLLAA